MLSFKLKLLRSERGLSQNDVADMAKMTLRNYQNIEAGIGNPSLTSIYALAEALEVTTCKLLSLDYFRLNYSIDEFVHEFDVKFKNVKVAVNLRTLDGKIVYRNDKFKKALILPEEKDGTVDLLSVLDTGAREILRNQLSSERNGMTSPYVNFGYDAVSKEKLYFRFYPCLILPPKGRSPIMTAAYMTEISEDCQKNYFLFCKHLIECFKE